MYDDYVSYAQRYKALYGASTTLVAYEVGKFLNWYNCDRGLGCDVIGVCECINVAVTRRNKNIAQVSAKNPMMGGVPRDAFFAKHLRVLLENDYTVVVVSQLSPPTSSAPPARGVTDVISRGVCPDDVPLMPSHAAAASSQAGGGGEGGAGGGGASMSSGSFHHHHRPNAVMTLYVDAALPCGGPRNCRSSRSRGGDRAIAGAGCAFVDLGTGHSSAFEIVGSEDDPNLARDETCRLVQEYEPKEVVLLGRPASLEALLGIAAASSASTCSEASSIRGEEKSSRSKTDAASPFPSPSSFSSSSSAATATTTADDLVLAFSRDVGVNPRAVRARLSDSSDDLAALEKVRFQEHALRAVFPDTGFLSALEALDLERRPHAAAAYVGMLGFVREHNEHVLDEMPRPEVHTADGETETALELTYNASEQLDIIAPSSSSGSTTTNGSAAVGGGGGGGGGSGTAAAAAATKGTLFDVLDSCCTAMGRRLLRRRLLHPSCDQRTIEERLDDVEALLLLLPRPRLLEARSCLSGVRDLDRLFRRIALRRVEPCEFDLLDASLAGVEHAAAACSIGDGNDGTASKEEEEEREGGGNGRTASPPLSSLSRRQEKAAGDLVERARSLRRRIKERLDLDEARKVVCVADARTNFFVRGAFADLDALQDAHAASRSLLEQAVAWLNARQGSGHFKLVQDDVASVPYIVGTSRRCAAMRQALGRETMVLLSPRPVSVSVSEVQAANLSSGSSGDNKDGPSTGTAARLVHPAFERWGKEATEASQVLRKRVRQEYAAFLDDLWFRSDDGGGGGREQMRLLARAAAETDVACACAFNAWRMRHCRPTFGPAVSFSSDGGDGRTTEADGGGGGGGGGEEEHRHSSELRCVALRHPIVEALQTRVPHVANDLRVGAPDARGALLFGMNAAGKSCLMKAAALAVVMAQAGMYVPCDAMHVTVPFRRVLTRIRSRDDLVRGQSTFMVEIAELRDILQRSDARSLVIGDEVCSGTESVSALAIVGASVRQLLAKRTPFVFATHLHELPPLLERLLARERDEARRRLYAGLRVCHLRVDYDPATGELVYDRRLCPGQGPTVYGLEVCRALDMRPEFLDAAHAIRRAVLQTKGDEQEERDPLLLLGRPPPRVSHYNARVVMGACGLCGAAPSRETHHILPQAAADADGYVGTRHKNVEHNLVPLCEACHDAVHAGRVDVHGYVQTSRGVRLRLRTFVAAASDGNEHDKYIDKDDVLDVESRDGRGSQ